MLAAIGFEGRARIRAHPVGTERRHVALPARRRLGCFESDVVAAIAAADGRELQVSYVRVLAGHGFLQGR